MIGYLEDALAEGGISLFILALKDVIKANNNYISSSQLINDLMSDNDPKISSVFDILDHLGLKIKLKLKC